MSGSKARSTLSRSFVGLAVIATPVLFRCSADIGQSKEITGVKEPPPGSTTGTGRDTGTTADPPGGGGAAGTGGAGGNGGATGRDASVAPPPIAPDAGGPLPDAGPPHPTSWLVTTSDLNLRKGPSTAEAILRVMPQGSMVLVLDPSAVNEFLHLDHQGLVGWGHRDYLRAANSGDAGADGGPGTGVPPTSTIAAAIERAKSGVGFSYWWGHGRWLPTGPTAANKGSCTGSCPDCTHTGSYGADCSGYVGQIWQVPASNNDITVDKHPYSTADFVTDTALWSTIARDQLKLGDSLVYNEDGAGHIFLYASGDGWGSMDAYECKGCATGCVFNLRTASSTFKAIRRTGY